MALDEFVWLRSLVQDEEPGLAWIDATARRLEAQFTAEATVDRVLRGAVDHAEPIDTATSSARLALERHIASAKRPRGWKWGIATAAVLGAVVLVGAVMVLLPSPASALTDLARATEVLPNETYTGDDVVRESDEIVLMISDAFGVSYLQPLHRVRRVTADMEQVRIINDDPIFFTPQAEATYGTQVRADARPGATQTLTTTRPDTEGVDGLPNDDYDVLAAALKEYVVSVGDPAVSDDVEILELIGEIYRTSLPQPTERAALIRVAASLETAEPVDVVAPEVTAIRIEHTSRGMRESYTIGFNQAGWMVYDEALLLEPIPEIGIPTDTPFSRNIYAVPTSD